MIKLHIKVGTSEIQLEGKIDEVEKILSKHWEPYVETIISTAPQAIIETPSKPQPQAKTRPRKTAKSRSEPETKDGKRIGYQNLANTIKGHKLSEELLKHAINSTASPIHRIKGILFALEAPLSVGDIHEIQLELKMKADRGNILKTFNKSMADFLKSGEKPVKFEMTQKATDDFAVWLNKDDA